MILRTIYLNISELSIPSDKRYAFLCRSRYICNWVEREVLKRLRFRSDGFNRIVVNLCSNPRAAAYVNTSNVACVEIPFSAREIDADEGESSTKLQLSMLKAGIEKCAITYEIPTAEVIEGLDTFLAQGMKNEWLHKKRTFKDHKLVAALSCKMTDSAFSLRLTIARDGKTLVDETILKTDPDEIAFEWKFKNIEIVGGRIIVNSKFDRPLWSKSLKELL